MGVNFRKKRFLFWLTAFFFLSIVFGLISLDRDARAEEDGNATKLVMLIGSDSYVSPLVNSYHELLKEGYDFQLKIFHSKYLSETETQAKLTAELQDADIFLLEMIGSGSAEVIKSILQETPDSCKILATRCGNTFADQPRIDTSEDNWLKSYFENGSTENMQRMELYLVSKYGQVATAKDLNPLIIKDSFIYHPDAVRSELATVAETVYGSVYDSVYQLPPGCFSSPGGYLSWYQESGKLKEGAPWIGMLTYDSNFKNDDMEMYLDTLNALEDKGANVMLVFSNSKRDETVRKFFMTDGHSNIDFLIAGVGFNFIYGQAEKGIELFSELNVPVMTPVYSSNLEDWEKNPAGISKDIYWQIAYPELDGRIEPVLLGGSKVIGSDELTGAQIEKKVPLPDRIERAAERVLNWAELRHKSNSDKKVAVIYYNHAGGKDDIGASYLNVFESAALILQALKNDGYSVDGDLNTENIAKLIFAQGRNVGSWAPGELDELVQAGALTIPTEKYLEWFQTLPQELREEVEREWGAAPGNVMVHNGQIVIPGFTMGNIFLGPQPMRGWGDDPDKIIHSPALPPTHQYIAFYLWLQHEYQADAVIHLGTHGTLEWLPGRSVGLGETDWPDVLIGNLPDIYPYIVNNPGEATQAKRRAYGVMIDHLTPPLIKPELYGDLAELQDLLMAYHIELSKGDSNRIEALKQEILTKIEETNIHEDLGLNLDQAEFNQIIPAVENYLEELSMELMPYGLHTFGQAPEGELLEAMTDAIVNYDPESRLSVREQIKNNITLSTQEIVNLLRALRGEYISPGLGRDPVRVPDVMPTGRNLVSFDPRMVPDKAAWTVGKELADQMLAKYFAEKGRYPETVGVVLWAVETMRTQGESVAMILRLIGAEPVWDASGRVTKVKITPVDELGRPRVDVLVTISGLFRDTFVNVVALLDDAFTQIALLEEDTGDNLVKKHYQDILAKFLADGLAADEAKMLAAARIYGDPPGAYGTGVAEMVKATSAWDSTKDLSDTYLARMSYIYGKSAYGKPATGAFQLNLQHIDLVAQVRDSVWGVLDNDDVFQYLGGLKLAAEAVSGEKVDAYIANTRNALNPRVESLGQFLGTELKTRLLNPKWIEGMLLEGISGARTIAKHIENMFGVDATLDVVSDWDWQQVVETLVLNEQISNQLDAYTLQSIIGWNLEAARREMWQADQDTLNKLADIYIQRAADYGVVCCHHTCANLVFNEWVASYATLDGTTIDKFAEVFNKATDKELHIRGKNIVRSDEDDSQQNPLDNLVETTVPTVTLIQPEVPASVQEPNNLGNDLSVKPIDNDEQQNKLQENSEPREDLFKQLANKRIEQVAQKNTKAIESGAGEIKEEKSGTKAYEINIKKETSKSKGGKSSVNFYAVLGAMAILGLIAKGYLFNRY